MGVTGHNHVEMFFGPDDDSFLQILQLCSEFGNLPLEPQPGISSHLVIATFSHVELAANFLP